MAEREALQVGQEVIIHNQNERRLGGATVGTITKIGRTLVTIKGPYGREEKYEIEHQSIRDNYGHAWFRTQEQEAVTVQREADIATLAEHGFKLDYHAKPTDDVLHRVAEFLRADPVGELLP